VGGRGEKVQGPHGFKWGCGQGGKRGQSGRKGKEEKILPKRLETQEKLRDIAGRKLKMEGIGRQTREQCRRRGSQLITYTTLIQYLDKISKMWKVAEGNFKHVMDTMGKEEVCMVQFVCGGKGGGAK